MIYFSWMRLLQASKQAARVVTRDAGDMGMVQTAVLFFHVRVPAWRVHGSEGGDCRITSTNWRRRLSSVEGYPCRSLAMAWVQEHRESGLWDMISDLSWVDLCSDNLINNPSRTRGSNQFAAGMLMGLADMEAEGLERKTLVCLVVYLVWCWCCVWTCIKRLRLAHEHPGR